MANISLEGSIRTCKVDTAWANKLQSDRFLNPSLMMCPTWNNVDAAGRVVNPDTFYTKRGGCNSANDRIDVENSLRPQYIEYVTLDAQGIAGGLDCGRNPLANPDSMCNNKVVNAVHQQTGQFGLQTGFQQNIYPNCMSCQKYPDQRAYANQQARNNQYRKESFNSLRRRVNSGELPSVFY